MSDIRSPLDHHNTPQIMEDAGRAMPGLVAHALRIAVWGTLHFFLSLAEQIAGLVAPLLLVVGGIWMTARHAAGLVEAHEEQVQAILNQVSTILDHDVVLAGHSLSPLELIVDGLILMAISAACHTLGLVLANEMYDER